MSLAELVQSSGWKNFIAKLYGLGASVVIIGALLASGRNHAYNWSAYRSSYLLLFGL
jgi:hypothetical protein